MGENIRTSLKAIRSKCYDEFRCHPEVCNIWLQLGHEPAFQSGVDGKKCKVCHTFVPLDFPSQLHVCPDPRGNSKQARKRLKLEQNTLFTIDQSPTQTDCKGVVKCALCHQSNTQRNHICSGVGLRMVWWDMHAEARINPEKQHHWGHSYNSAGMLNNARRHAMQKFTGPVVVSLKNRKQRVLYVGLVEGMGRGLFAVEDMKKGDTVCAYSGTVFEGDHNNSQSLSFLKMQLANGDWVQVQPESTFCVGVSANHAHQDPNMQCNPVCNTALLQCMRNVKAGEELTWNYQAITDKESEAERCRCKHCQAYPVDIDTAKKDRKYWLVWCSGWDALL